VILSITDITSRKLIELSLLERERFWSDVVRTVPDHLYVQDVISQRMIFSNHHLGQTLGYNRTELQQMGEYFWKSCCTPKTPTITVAPGPEASRLSAIDAVSVALPSPTADGGASRFASRLWQGTSTTRSRGLSAWPRTSPTRSKPVNPCATANSATACSPKASAT
jgi:PAS domain-containing protein